MILITMTFFAFPKKKNTPIMRNRITFHFVSHHKSLVHLNPQTLELFLGKKEGMWAFHPLDEPRAIV